MGAISNYNAVFNEGTFINASCLRLSLGVKVNGGNSHLGDMH